MTTTAILFMTLSVGAVLLLACWCYYKVLTAPPRDE
jgi:hypothetical protein